MLLDTLKGIANTSAPPMRSKPFMAEQRYEILDHVDPADPADVSAGALLSLMLSCALRGTEATALDLGRLGSNRDDDINAGFVVIREEGLEVTLTRSKTSRSTAIVMPVPAPPRQSRPGGTRHAKWRPSPHGSAPAGGKPCRSPPAIWSLPSLSADVRTVTIKCSLRVAKPPSQ
jgi:hypothetical protein